MPIAPRSINSDPSAASRCYFDCLIKKRRSPVAGIKTLVPARCHKDGIVQIEEQLASHVGTDDLLDLGDFRIPVRLQEIDLVADESIAGNRWKRMLDPVGVEVNYGLATELRGRDACRQRIRSTGCCPRRCNR